LAPPVVDHALRDLGAFPVEAVEGAGGHVQEELRAVVGQGLAEAVEYFDGRAAGIGLGLDHERGDGADQHGLGDPALRLAMAGDVAGDFAAAGGVADVDRILQVEMFGNSESVCSVVIHVVAVADLGGAAVAAAVVRNDTKALGEEEQHLGVPVIAGQGPAMVEHDGLGRLGAPILEEDFNAVGGSDRTHVGFSGVSWTAGID
jgi:hypothetical protein